MGDEYYMASDYPLPLIPWSERNPSLWVEEVDERIDTQLAGIHSRFSKPYVYYVGSHTHDGCGFRREEIWLSEEDEAYTQATMSQLSAYLTEAAKLGDIELYTGWMTHGVNDPIEHRQTITPETIGQADFEFKDNQLLTISASNPVS